MKAQPSSPTATRCRSSNRPDDSPAGPPPGPRRRWCCRRGPDPLDRAHHAKLPRRLTMRLFLIRNLCSNPDHPANLLRPPRGPLSQAPLHGWLRCGVLRGTRYPTLRPPRSWSRRAARRGPRCPERRLEAYEGRRSPADSAARPDQAGSSRALTPGSPRGHPAGPHGRSSPATPAAPATADSKRPPAIRIVPRGVLGARRYHCTRRPGMIATPAGLPSTRSPAG